MADTLRVLYVDDEPGLLGIGKLFLERGGAFAVDTFSSARLALEQLGSERYDAIISDYQMPEMDGITFLKQLKASGNSTPFIIFTGKGREEVVIEALNEGADFYIQKGGEPKAQFVELANKIHYAVTRKRAEEALLASVKELGEASSRYKALIAASNTGAWEYHGDTGFLWCSPEYFSMLGHDISDFDLSGRRNIETTWSDLLHPDDREKASSIFDAYLKDPVGIYEQYFRMQHKDGHWVWIWSRGKTLVDVNGKPTGITVGTHIDINDSRRAGEALYESESFNRGLVENLPDYIAVYGQDGKILFVNPACVRALGYSSADLAGTPVLSYVAIESHDAVAAAMAAHLEGDDPAAYEIDLVTKDGHRRSVIAKGSRIQYYDRPAILLLLTDITERKATEAALQRQSATLSILNGIISTTNKAGDLPGLLNRILAESLRLLDFDAGGIYLVDPAARMANLVCSKNLPPAFLADIQAVPIDKKPFDRLFIQNELFITDNYAQVNPGQYEKYGFQSMASIPLLSKGVATGALNIASMRRYTISEEEQQTLVSISRELGSAIERITAEQEVKKVANNFAALFDSIDEMVFVLDMQGCILVVNDAVLKRLSYSQGELTGTNILLLHVPERRDEALRIVQGMIAGTIDSCPVPVLTKDGTRIDVETKVTRGWWNNQEVLIGVSRDVTERKKADVALRESEEKYRLIFDNSPLGNLSFDENGVILACNDKFIQIIGSSRDALIGLNMRRLPDEKIVSAVEKALKGSNGLYEGVYSSVTGKKATPVRGLFAPMNLGGGRIPGGVGIFEDITDRKKDEEAIRENRATYRELVESISDVIFEIDSDGTITNISPVIYNVLEYEPVEIIGRNFSDFIYHEDRDLLIKRFSELTRAIQHPMEYRVTTKSGGVRWVRTQSKPIMAVEKFCGARGTLIDITERKLSEESLRLFRDLVEHSSDAIGIATPGGRHYYQNEAFDRLFGPVGDYPPASLFVDKTTGKEVFDTILSGGTWQGEVKMYRADKTILDILLRAYAIRNQDGRIIGLAGMHIDVTERNRAESALRESEEKIRLLLNSTAEAIYGLDTDGNCIFCNTSCLNMLGYKDPGDLLGRNMHWQIHAKHPDGTHFPVEDCRIFQAFNKGECAHVDDEVFWRADGTSFPAEYWSYPQRHNGAVIGAVVTFLDISERKELEAEMKYHEQELMQFSSSLTAANRKLTLLSGITRHDISNQLTVLMGYLSILEKKQPDPDHNDYFRKVTTAAQRIAAMIQFTREYEEIGVNAPAWQDCRRLVDTAAKQAHLGTVVVDNDLPAGAEIFADPLITRVFYNLMDNAVLYGGKISTIRFSVEDHGGDLVIVCVDDGEGVPVPDKERIFTRGFGKNTGLGLAISREVLSISSITIKETGEPGKGARFEMTVPEGMWRMAAGGVP